MRKYTIARSFLMITSVLASTPFRMHGRQAVTVISPPAATTSTAAQSSAVQTTPTSAPSTSNIVTTSAAATTSSAQPHTTEATTIASTIASTTAAPSSTTAAPTSSISATSTPTSTSASPSSTQVVTSASISTDSQGSPTTVIVTSTPSPVSSSASPSATNTSQDNSIHTGTIVGLSVAGGIAALAIIGFIIWKVTRKRFADLDDTDEAIKWPELNREHTNNDDGLSRQPSNPYSTNAPSRNASTLDQSEFSDPYAVPPLPQFNPNQPYRDDPYATSNTGYYDPYRGPIPQTFQEGSGDGHENIPMSTYPPGTRGRSPGPGAAYDMGGRGSPAPGRASPALGQSGYDMGGRGSPAPGRTISPGPAAALGLDRRPSPGVQNAYSVPPEMAVRNRSPGPNVLG